MLNKLNKVAIWAPGIYDSKGGIQNYLANLVSAFEELIGGKNVYVFCKNDNDVLKLTELSKSVNWFTISSKDKFINLKYGVYSFFKTLKISPDIAICGHLNFSKAFLPYMYAETTRTWILCYGIECWDVKDLLKKQVLRSVNSTLSISRYTKEQIVKNNLIYPEKGHILPVTFNENQFKISFDDGLSVRKKLGLTNYDKIILTVSRMSSKEQYKGYDTVLHLIPKLVRYEPSLKYLIVGKGDDISRIVELVKNLGIESNVFLIGYVSDNELSSYYNACDVFCMPSTGEGFGIVFLEAMSCGKTVIGGNVDGTRDALLDGELGFLVNPYDQNQIFDTLLLALRNKIHHRLAFDPEKLREAVISRYGYKAFINKLTDILRIQGMEFC